jgi:hypothetical protein
MTLPLLAERAALPAQSPLSGWVWTWLVPALLFAVAFAATWLLYRKFRGD